MVIVRISLLINKPQKWGTIRPTKPIGPPIAVILEHKSTLAIIASDLILLTLTPRPTAISSPIAKAFKSDEINIAIKWPKIIKGSSVDIEDNVAAPRLPICQNLNLSKTLLFGKIKNLQNCLKPY